LPEAQWKFGDKFRVDRVSATVTPFRTSSSAIAERPRCRVS